MKIRCETPPTQNVTDSQAERMARWQRRMYMMALHALDDGVVLTIATEAKQPLAMGNYDLVLSVRPLRNHKD